MEFRILGPLEVVENDRSIDLGSPQQRVLLSLLLVHANRVVTTDRILEELWGDDADGKENALWVYVSRLRSTLEPDRDGRGKSSVLLTRDHGYVLSVEGHVVDSLEFEHRAAEGLSLVKHDPDAASEMLMRALQLWRGSALEDAADHQFAQLETVRLEELRLVAVEGRIEADLRRGRAGELVGELESLRSEHSMRESFVRQLMLALYQSGRPADALRAFDRFRRHIGEELGIEPSPELRRLEEQVLLHDPRIRSRLGEITPIESAIRAAKNPFKGLRAFGEDDSSDFFGRERLVAEVVKRIAQGQRLIALVGASGSGKSSVARAGVVPALRKGVITGSQGWPIAQMVPSDRPFAELEMALLRSSLDGPDSLAGQLAHPDDGVLRAMLQMLPNENSRLVLVIDQFEELFTLTTDNDKRRRFIANLLPVIDDPHGRVTVVLTLRADFYDRPLAYPEFGSRFGDSVVNVVALTPDELEEAAQKPAEDAGVSLAPALLASLITDVLGQPGALPLFQYTLTELFDRRVDDALSLDGYRSMDGLRGALTRRADELFTELDPAQQAAATQLFLRLVTIAEGDEWGRRRVPASEIVALDVDLVAAQAVVELFAGHRLLTVDRDYVSGSPTVEVAHEALLTEWGRLRGWVEESREDVTRHAALTSAMTEWIEADRHPDFLLTGSRLAGYERWAATATMRLTDDEREYLDAAVESRGHAQRSENQRTAQERKTERAARRRLWGLITAGATVVGLGVGLYALVSEPDPVRVALVAPSAGTFGREGLLETGVAQAERELDVDIELLTGQFTSLDQQYRDLAEAGTELIFIDSDRSGFGYVGEVIADYPDTTFAVIDGILPLPSPGQSVYFADEQGGYVAGLAAALTTETGTVGFVGGYEEDTTERWRGGFEAGAQAIDPDIIVLATYVSTKQAGHELVAGGRAAAEQLFQRNADVVLAFTGDATVGVLEAASEQSNATGTHRWVIGSGSDWSVAVANDLRPYLLTSALRKWDVATFETIKAFTEGALAPGSNVLTLADGALGLAPSRNLTDDDMARIGELSSDVAAGVATVPHAPVGELIPPPGVEVVDTVTVTWDGQSCSYAEGDPTTFEPGATVRVEFVNLTTDYRRFDAIKQEDFWVIELSTLVQPQASNSGFVRVGANPVSFLCLLETRFINQYLLPPQEVARNAAMRDGDPVGLSVDPPGE